jgi:hypothetical protein
MHCHISDKVVADGLGVRPERSVWTLKIIFTESGTFGFFSSFQQADGPCMFPDDAILSFG